MRSARKVYTEKLQKCEDREWQRNCSNASDCLLLNLRNKKDRIKFYFPLSLSLSLSCFLTPHHRK